MLGVICAVIAIVVITAHHFLIERPRHRAEPPPGPIPLSAAMGRLPKGIFLQSTYTWSTIRASGELLVGVHPILLSLVGAPHKLELLAHNGRVEKGEPFIRIGEADRCLTLHSPVTGRVLAQRHVAKDEMRWDSMTEEDGGWLCRIRPENMAEEIPTWMIADRALEWTKRKYGEIRDHLLKAVAERELTLTMADGGEIPVGILAEFDGSEWQAFQDAFLHT
ncbi:MAG: hypothetical protein JSV86_19770 [Gemmatimonadota bacterium]|nr:MAG: hypothetical protein JSV86_19770 [Gemmatimonadota bacterium]